MLAGVAFGFIQVTPCATRTPSCSRQHLKVHGGMLAFSMQPVCLMTAAGHLTCVAVQGMFKHEAHTHTMCPQLRVPLLQQNIERCADR